MQKECKIWGILRADMDSVYFLYKLIIYVCACMYVLAWGGYTKLVDTATTFTNKITGGGD